MIKSVDNQQVFDRFATSHNVVIFLTNTITSTLMAGGAILIWNTIDVQYKINKTASPPLLVWLLSGLSLLNFAFILTFTALAVGYSRQYYYIFVISYMAGSFILLLVIADISVWNVRSLVLRYQDRFASSTVQTKLQAAEKSLYPLYAFVLFLNGLLLVVIGALIYKADLISTSGVTNNPPDVAHPWQWSIDIFAWVHVCVIFVFLWWSWVPLHVLSPIAKKMGISFFEESVNQVTPVANRAGTGTFAVEYPNDNNGATPAATSHKSVLHSNMLNSPQSNTTTKATKTAISAGSILVQPRTEPTQTNVVLHPLRDSIIGARESVVGIRESVIGGDLMSHNYHPEPSTSQMRTFQNGTPHDNKKEGRGKDKDTIPVSSTPVQKHSPSPFRNGGKSVPSGPNTPGRNVNNANPGETEFSLNPSTRMSTLSGNVTIDMSSFNNQTTTSSDAHVISTVSGNSSHHQHAVTSVSSHPNAVAPTPLLPANQFQSHQGEDVEEFSVSDLNSPKTVLHKDTK